MFSLSLASYTSHLEHRQFLSIVNDQEFDATQAATCREATREELLICLQQMLTDCNEAWIRNRRESRYRRYLRWTLRLVQEAQRSTRYTLDIVGISCSQEMTYGYRIGYRVLLGRFGKY